MLCFVLICRYATKYVGERYSVSQQPPDQSSFNKSQQGQQPGQSQSWHQQPTQPNNISSWIRPPLPPGQTNWNQQPFDPTQSNQPPPPLPFDQYQWHQQAAPFQFQP